MTEKENEDTIKNITVNFCVEICDLEFGKPIKDYDRDNKTRGVMTLKKYAGRTILLPPKDGGERTEEEKLERCDLAGRIFKSDGPLDMTINEVKMVKDSICQNMPDQIVGLCFEHLPK